MYEVYPKHRMKGGKHFKKKVRAAHYAKKHHGKLYKLTKVRI